MAAGEGPLRRVASTRKNIIRRAVYKIENCIRGENGEASCKDKCLQSIGLVG